MNNQQLIEDLKATKAYLQEHGRCSRGPTGDNGQVCVVIAAQRARVQSSTTTTMLRALAAYVPVETPVLYGWPLEDRALEDRAIDYNEWDRVTDQDVYNLFDKVIADLGGAL